MLQRQRGTANLHRGTLQRLNLYKFNFVSHVYKGDMYLVTELKELFSTKEAAVSS